ncbi:MAG TPA: iron ABC transporter permease [Actinomycetota bacterium]
MATATAEVRLRPTRLRPGLLGIALGVLALAGLAGVLIGPVGLSPKGVLLELLDRVPFVGVSSGLAEREQAILWQIRLPRVVVGGMVGAALAMAGAAYQGVFRNPLADPYLLGAAAGAGLGATLAVAYLPSAGGPVGPLPAAAFLGALVGVGAAYGLGRSVGRSRTSGTLILAGVAVASFLTAVQTYFQQREDDTLRQVFAWILGTLGTVTWREAALMAPYFLVGGVVLLVHRRLLDVLSLGDEEAESLGVRAGRVRLVIVVAASLATAAAVAVSGLIGFVGIIVPHAVRLAFGGSYRLVLPLSIAFGAAFLVLTDLAARTILAPAEIPIGVVTAFFGAPFFLAVLRRSKGMA